MKERQKRPSADKTRHAIMKSARKLFAKNGFSGTSISMLAKAAGIVNQSLIYHHFANKEELWVAVKSEVISKFDMVTYEGSDLEEFVRVIVENRVDFFNRNPDFQRVLYWQRLEGTSASSKQFFGLYSDVASNLLMQIQRLQKEGVINEALSPHMVLMLIVAICNGAHRDGPEDFATVNEANQKAYLAMAIPGLVAALKP